jgi:Domain of unknown function (DUF4145)
MVAMPPLRGRVAVVSRRGELGVRELGWLRARPAPFINAANAQLATALLCEVSTGTAGTWMEVISSTSFCIPSARRRYADCHGRLRKGMRQLGKFGILARMHYGVLLGRVLDAVCEDRQAIGDTLDQKLKSLADKRDIPEKLVKVAAGMRKLRNIGAHADLGELTEAELPVLDDLTRAILEYVYAAPLLATEAEERFTRLKRKNAPRKSSQRRTKTTVPLPPAP